MDSDIVEGRCFVNRLAGVSLDGASLAANGCALAPSCQEEILLLEMQILNSIVSGTEEANCDESVYVGGPGIAYMLTKSAVMRGDRELLKQAQCFLTRWQAEAAQAAIDEPDFGCSLLCGQAGWLCVHALWCHAAGDGNGAAQSAALYSSMGNIAQSHEALDSDEWLYGRAGYLHGALQLRHVLGVTCVPDGVVNGVADSILEAGEERVKRKKYAAPLMWKWSGREYLGAAHGVMGILFMLLHVESVVRDSKRRELLKNAINWLLTQKAASGNWPKVHGDRSRSAHLVHFCHGAPGVVQLLCKAHKVFADPRYLEEAKAAGDFVWRYGMLRKGVGLCHGFSGNAYSFLSLFRVTKDPQWLLRAHHFARTMFQPSIAERFGTPDHSLSLFEGTEGAA